MNDSNDTVVELGSLVAKSLVDATAAGDHFRYRFLRRCGSMARRRWSRQVSPTHVRARHADWIVDAIESTPLEVRWLDDFERRARALADIRGALKWTTGAARNDMAALLASGINWTSADAWREGTRWCEAVVDAEDIPLPVRSACSSHWVLSTTMALSRRIGRVGEAAIETADDLVDPVVARPGRTAGTSSAVTAVTSQDDHLARRVSEWAERGVAMSEEFEAPWHVYCRCLAGMTYSSLDQPEPAQSHLEEGARWLRDLEGYEGLRASTLGLLSVHRIIQGDHERAYAAAEPIVATVHTPMPGREGALMAVVARAAAGDLAAARIEMNEYYEAARRTDLPLGVETVVIYGGVIAGLQGNWEACARLLAAGAAGLARFPGTYLLYKEFRDRARAALGPDRARELRAEGQQLPLEVAVTSVLGDA